MNVRNTGRKKSTQRTAHRAAAKNAFDTSDKAGNEGPPIGTGTPIAHAPLPPSSGSAGAKKG